MKILKCFLFLLPFVLSGCLKDIAPNANDEEPQTRAEHKDGGVFYYYGVEDRKIFLNLAKDKIFLKFAPDATKEQFLSVVNSDVSLRPMEANSEEYFVEGYHSNAVVLEGKEISPDVFDSFKAREEIVSATYHIRSSIFRN